MNEESLLWVAGNGPLEAMAQEKARIPDEVAALFTPDGCPRGSPRHGDKQTKCTGCDFDTLLPAGLVSILESDLLRDVSRHLRARLSVDQIQDARPRAVGAAGRERTVSGDCHESDAGCQAWRRRLCVSRYTWCRQVIWCGRG